IEISFVPGSWGFTDATTSDFVGPVSPQNFLVGGVATPNIGYLDVQLTPTKGDALDLASIADSDPELAITGTGAGDVALLAAAAPTQLPNTNVFRYYLTGSFVPGTVTVTFIPGSFSSNGIANLGTDAHLVVQQLTGDIDDPLPGDTTTTDQLN